MKVGHLSVSETTAISDTTAKLCNSPNPSFILCFLKQVDENGEKVVTFKTNEHYITSSVNI